MGPSKTYVARPPSIILLFATMVQVACLPLGCTQQSPPPPGALEFRIVLDEDRCRVDCQIVELEPLELGRRMKLWVHRNADLLIESGDVISVVPSRLSRIDPDRPDSIVWTGTLKLAPRAADQLRGLGERLGPQQQILISRNGEPLDVTHARLVGQMMSVGDFESYDELAEALGGIGRFEEAREDVVEVFSAEELEAKRKRREMLEESEAMLREAERIREDAVAGRITEEEMMRQLKELRQ